jgi:hypothetical protein
MDLETQHKWDRVSGSFDFVSFGDDQRLGPHKRRLFEKIRGSILMVAAGTGKRLPVLPARPVGWPPVAPYSRQNASSTNSVNWFESSNRGGHREERDLKRTRIVLSKVPDAAIAVACADYQARQK